MSPCSYYQLHCKIYLAWAKRKIKTNLSCRITEAGGSIKDVSWLVRAFTLNKQLTSPMRPSLLVVRNFLWEYTRSHIGKCSCFFRIYIALLGMLQIEKRYKHKTLSITNHCEKSIYYSKKIVYWKTRNLQSVTCRRNFKAFHARSIQQALQYVMSWRRKKCKEKEGY